MLRNNLTHPLTHMGVSIYIHHIVTFIYLYREIRRLGVIFGREVCPAHPHNVTREAMA
jgi:hypothetical protein